jgi:tetratricopeptide (TPR) repeat protein
MADKSHNSLRRLRKRVERALAGGDRGIDVLRDLEAIVRGTDEGNRDALFAHRQLAELLLEQSPWRAALHLRKLIHADAADDGVFALMGLCQAMLGNFRSAIASYQRAIELASRNPWYHHNLGHLLDVGLGRCAIAVRHLRLAHELEPGEDEITASLAHCLARLGELPEAKALARQAARSAPGNTDHRQLLEWIERGAPSTRDGQKRQGARGRIRASGGALRADTRDSVARLLADRMPDAGFSPDHVRLAHALWTDFSGRRSLRVAKPAIYAAAIEYAIAVVHGVRGVTQAAVGRRYGVAPASLSSRYAEIRAELALVPGDPRYGGGVS